MSFRQHNMLKKLKNVGPNFFSLTLLFLTKYYRMIIHSLLSKDLMLKEY